MKKKILGLVISLASLACMAGCGSSKAEKNEKHDYKVGDYLTYGSYEQDNNKSNGKEPIEWEIICVEDGKALIISKYGLDVKIYDTHKNGSTWETCSLRSWLNNEFLNDNFSDSEKKKIIKTIVTADDNEKFEISGGNDTEDKIFLLSIKEVEQYLTTESSRECIPTEYAKTVSDLFFDNNDDGKDDYECCAWWLRTVGDYNNYASCIWPEDAEGGHYHEIADVAVTDDYCALRPAMWIDISSLVEDSVVENDKTTETEKNDETVTNPNASAEEKYNAAILLMESGKYEEAMKIFDSIFTYKDSFEKSEECKKKSEELKYEDKYKNGVELMDSGKYEAAAELFANMLVYKDSQEKLVECNLKIDEIKYNKAIELAELGKYDDAFAEAEKIQDSDILHLCREEIIKCKIESVSRGQIIELGKYEQDGDLTNGKEIIEWVVIDIVDTKALVISKYALDNKKYTESRFQKNITWETCTLRSWLNNEFYYQVFTTNEMDKIITSTVQAHSNPNTMIHPKQGNATYDKLFLLSVQEYKNYFVNNEDGICEYTKYAKGSYLSCNYWLRTMGGPLEATMVSAYNWSADTYGTLVDNSLYVRPAMWIDLTK